MYSIVLPTGGGALRQINAAHDHVMTRLIAALQRQRPEVRRDGVCDGVIGDRKFSGNSLRIARGHLLYHGTVLHDADLDLIASALAHAPRQPQYRGGRDHRSFIGNLQLDPSKLDEDLANEFGVNEDLDGSQLEASVADLMSSRYGRVAWHRRH